MLKQRSFPTMTTDNALSVSVSMLRDGNNVSIQPISLCSFVKTGNKDIQIEASFLWFNTIDMLPVSSAWNWIQFRMELNGEERQWCGTASFSLKKQSFPPLVCFYPPFAPKWTACVAPPFRHPFRPLGAPTEEYRKICTAHHACF